jgi:membrane-bound ClpP family serine protease
MLLEIISKLPDVIGIVGVVLLLIAYYLLSSHKMSAYSMKYQVLNCLGACLILFSLFFHWNTAAVIIEVAWILISMISMIRLLRGRNREKTSSSKSHSSQLNAPPV